MKKRNTTLVDSKGRPIYGTIPDGESQKAVVREVDFWRSLGFGFARLKAVARRPLTVDGIRRSVVHHAKFKGRWEEMEAAAEKRSKAASGPRKVAVKGRRAKLYAEIKGKYPARSDEVIADEIAHALNEPEEGALKRLKRALNRKP